MSYDSPTTATAREVLTVSALTQQIKFLIESKLGPVWLSGEVSNFKRHNSGHFYFSLKDENCQIPCVMWASRNRALYFAPQDGMQVVVNGQVVVYEKRGNYQLEVWHMQPAGAGALQMAFEQLKQRLHKEGLFDAAHKIPLPKYPQSVGLITSPSGAAIRDLVSVLRRRWPAIKIILRPVRVQGQGAAQDIAQAIEEFNRFGKVEVLIVGRGGGSLEDLWPFNEEIVARAIYASELPIVSAVGHEIDFSISDFVADVRAATPSVAAEIVVPDVGQVRKVLKESIHRGYRNLQRRMQSHREVLDRFARSYGLRRAPDLIRQRRLELDELHRRFVQEMQQILAGRKQELDGLHDHLQSLSYENIMRRGFSIVQRKRGDLTVTRREELMNNEMVRIWFAEGKVEARVEERDLPNFRIDILSEFTN